MPQVGNPSAGALGASWCLLQGKNITAGKNIGFAYGQHTTVAASDEVATGLAKVLYAVATLQSAPVAGATWATADVGTQGQAPAYGGILIKTWKPTASGDTAPIAATTFSKLVNWIAVGELAR